MSDVFLCPDCELVFVDEPNSMCAMCTRWREQKLAAMGDEYQAQQERRARLRMSPQARFAEDLSDMVKAVEKSRQVK